MTKHPKEQRLEDELAEFDPPSDFPLRLACWLCDRKLRKPDKAKRALCHDCATGGGLGPYT